MLAALVVLFITSFVAVYRTVYEGTEKNSRTIVSFFADNTVDRADMQGVPVDENFAPEILRYAEYMCKWYDIDYAYMFVPDAEAGTVTYLGVAAGESAIGTDKDGDMVGLTKDYVLTDEELAVWNGEADYARVEQDNKYGLSPAEILSRTNDTLAENNAAMQFVTAFVGIYDGLSGRYAYSNAGHNVPYVISDKVTRLDGAKGTMLGLLRFFT